MKSYLFVGIDTHKDSHTAAVLDGYFEVVATISFTNSSTGFAGFEEKLKKLYSGREIVLGMEESKGMGSFRAR